MAEVQIVQIAEGHEVEYRGRRSYRPRTIRVGRVWHVLYDGEVIGAILYALRTRERRTSGRGYVDARWQSPAWLLIRGEKAKEATLGYASAFGRAGEATSKKAAVESIVLDHERSLRD